MNVTVDFVDAVNSNVWSINLTLQDEIFINDVWYREDILLVDLSKTEPFTGKTTWSDLEILHYQILLFRAFDKLLPDHPIDELAIKFKEPFQTFKFLASAIAKMANIEGITGYDRIIIARPFDSRVVVDFRRTFRFNWDTYVPPAPKPKRAPFQLVVDNTK